MYHTVHLQERLLDILYVFSEGGKSLPEPGWPIQYRSQHWVNLARYQETYRRWPATGSPSVDDYFTCTYTSWSAESKQDEIVKARSALASWFRIHLDHKSAFLQGVKPTALPEPTYSSGREQAEWRGDTISVSDILAAFPAEGPIPATAADAFKDADEKLLAFVLKHAKCKDKEWSREMTHPRGDKRGIIAVLRERMRCLLIICEGLEWEPILMDSGQEEDHYRSVPINHPAQSEQDARQEFARKLVNPDDEWIAHVKMPTGYYEVKLAPPVEEEEDQQQLENVRSRQGRYAAKPRPELSTFVTKKLTGASTGESIAPASSSPRTRISRRSPSAGTEL
jgi:hypothetical protein